MPGKSMTTKDKYVNLTGRIYATIKSFMQIENVC